MNMKAEQPAPAPPAKEAPAILVNKNFLAYLFNEWMRRYINKPEQFAREWRAIKEFLAQEKAGAEPDYGQTCVAYLQELAKELGNSINFVAEKSDT